MFIQKTFRVFIIVLIASFSSAFAVNQVQAQESSAVETQETAEVTLKGTVVDAATGEVLSGVEVEILENTTTAETNEDGKFEITGLQAGESYTLSIEHDGYEDFEKSITAEEAQGALEVDIELQPSE